MKSASRTIGASVVVLACGTAAGQPAGRLDPEAMQLLQRKLPSGLQTRPFGEFRNPVLQPLDAPTAPGHLLPMFKTLPRPPTGKNGDSVQWPDVKPWSGPIVSGSRLPPKKPCCLNDNRGQDDIESNPVVTSLNGNQPLVPAWGTTGQVTTCNSALVDLRRNGRNNAAGGPIKPGSRAWNAEKSFVDSCLDQVDRRIVDRLGLLRLAGVKTICTVFFIAPTKVLTARHCLMKPTLGGAFGVASFRPIVNDLAQLTIEAGKREITLVGFKLVTGSGEVQSGGRLLSFDTNLEEVAQSDYVILETASPIADSLPSIALSEPRTGEKVVLSAYHEPVAVLGYQGDTGFRQQAAGYCQIIQPRVGERCLTHTCSTSPGSSGAPMFVERPDGLFLVGLHTSGRRSDTSCPGIAELDGVINYGVRFVPQGLNEIL